MTISMTVNNLYLSHAIQSEIQKFEACFRWLEQEMPPRFFEEFKQDDLFLVAHTLIGFNLQNYFCTLNLKGYAIALCLDSADADLRILENYENYGIKNYITFVSRTPPPFPNVTANLRIALINFTEAVPDYDKSFFVQSKEKLRELVKQRNPRLTDSEFDKLIVEINSTFLKSMSIDRLVLALDLLFRAKTRDNCQFEVRFDEEWKENNKPSMQIVMAWRNTPKHNFLYRLAYIIHRHGLVMQKVNSTYVDPYEKDGVLILSLAIHGANGKAAWDAANIPDFLRQLVTVKYFATFDDYETLLVKPGYISGLMGNLLRAMTPFIHQTLVHVDPNLYTIHNIVEGLTRHPELTQNICHAFQMKFNPECVDLEAYEKIKFSLMDDIIHLDTGNEETDTLRKNILKQALNMIHWCLKTNIYQSNYGALSFRMDPHYLESIPFDYKKKFPEMPYAIFFVKGMHYFGFHIRFKELARGGLRTVSPQKYDHVHSERNQVFTECYNLALTQQNKNKDIPEGGSKGIIFLKPDDQLISEVEILKWEFTQANLDPVESEKKLSRFISEQKLEYLYQAQRSFIESLLTIINTDENGRLRAKHVIDYWKKPEYLYLGPDENMHDSMIKWISETSKKHHYKPSTAFITGKPVLGINHKAYGVTSFGVNVYVEELLKFIGINPSEREFTVKMSGGPDGDVAGNEIVNLFRFYPKTAKLLAITDISGTIHDPKGLNLEVLNELFHKRLPLRHYPPTLLSEGGFLLDRETKRQDTALSVQTLLWRRVEGRLIEEWLGGSEMNAIFRTNVHRTKADIFIPGGGRPRSLNENNIKEFLDETGRPTSKLIVEGANLYLTTGARKKLEQLGVLIIKDSSANKGGVICSSFEVLCNLTMPDEKFIELKPILAEEILNRIKLCALNEVQLLLRTYKQTGTPLSEISAEISDKINFYTYKLLDHLDQIEIPNDPNDPFIKAFLDYCLPTLRNQFQKELLSIVPTHHKKACIACHLASQIVYKKGLDWVPSIIDILPLAIKEVST